ncbi:MULTISPECIES: AmmeMemoRadiSam system protein B [unclassified Bradyrhizobium]|uniref:AmmeMemoRadiSam system protein B n=1 Tax=unclassified Bradyrhizobium TaxID=2631580 RepID=UPI002916D3C7|nr:MULTISPECIES: AmmeMemoRadiSam system protein B [unclassified Bradyrhizobium]
MRHLTRRFVNGAMVSLFAGGPNALAALDSPRYHPQVHDASLFQKALQKERPAKVYPTVTGVTVPHHLLAADLIARGLWAASGKRYDQIILMSPDHFRKATKIIATTAIGFETPLGSVDVQATSVQQLLSSQDSVEESDLFIHEHGILAILPFIAFIFPEVPVVPLVLNTGSQIDSWNIVVDLVKSIITPNTLIVQSTDYSHFLLPGAARQRDQETLNLIATGVPTSVASLHQSNHIDSKAAQYVQLRLQSDFFNSHQVVIANRNSTEYAPYVGPSTSYIVSVFAQDSLILSSFKYNDHDLTYFGGDVFLGRYFNEPLRSQKTIDELVAVVRHAAGDGQRLVVNIEGAISSFPVVTEMIGRHIMDAALALPILKRMNVCAASLANNHSYDLGPTGIRNLLPLLSAAGVRAAQNMQCLDLGAFRMIALNFIGDGDHRGYPVVRKTGNSNAPIEAEERARILRVEGAPPVVAFVHWGREYTSEAGALERSIGEDLVRCGANLVVGAHSHQPSKLELTAEGQGLMLYSLGNLLFDQKSPKGDGVLLELRTFAQGTIAVRKVPIPNLYDFALEAARRA